MSSSSARRRPFLVTVLIVIFLGLALFGWVRLEQSIYEWPLLVQRVGEWLPVYSSISGALWGLVGLPAAWGLWRKRVWVKKAVWAGAVAYPVAYWIDRLFLSRSPESKVNWVFSAGVTLFWLSLVFFTLSRRRTLEYLRENTIDDTGQRKAT